MECQQVDDRDWSCWPLSHNPSALPCLSETALKMCLSHWALSSLLSLEILRGTAKKWSKKQFIWHIFGFPFPLHGSGLRLIQELSLLHMDVKSTAVVAQKLLFKNKLLPLFLACF